MTFGDYCKVRRMKLKMGLREFCRRHNLNPGNMSKIERDLALPSEKMTESLIIALRVRNGQWFREFARISKIVKTVPDERDILKKLPLLWAPAIQTEDVVAIIEAIKESMRPESERVD